MTDENSAAESTGIDRVTVLAVATVAYVLLKVLHEGLGHGLATIAVGGHVEGVSSSWCKGTYDGVGVWGVRVVKAAGTAVNLLAGVAFLTAFAKLSTRGATYYFLWLSAAVNLFVGGGYMMVDPVGGFGDWSQFLDGLEPAFVWKASIISLGVIISIRARRLLLSGIKPLLGSGTGRKAAAITLCVLPYFAIGGVLLTGAALLNSEGPKYALTSALATLGGSFFLAMLPRAVSDNAGPDASPLSFGVPRSGPWIFGGAMAAIFCISFFGPGIAF